MNILIDIGHPAHVHMFHCFAIEMQKSGHQVLFTCRDKEFAMGRWLHICKPLLYHLGTLGVKLLKKI